MFKKSQISPPVGADGDALDVYLGPHLKSDKVFIIDQVDPDTKYYDEAKVMIGFGSLNQALNFYRRAFSDGKGNQRIGAVHALSMSDFKKWLEHGNTTKPLTKALH